MLKNYVLQADIEKDFVGVLSTPDIVKPATLKAIKLPPEAEGVGWTEVKVGIANKLVSDPVGFGESEDITDKYFHTDKLYLGYSALTYDLNLKVWKYPFWVVLWVKNKTLSSHLYTFVVSVEE